MRKCMIIKMSLLLPLFFSNIAKADHAEKFAEFAAEIDRCPNNGAAKCAAIVLVRAIEYATSKRTNSPKYYFYNTIDCSTVAPVYTLEFSGTPGNGDLRKCEAYTQINSQQWALRIGDEKCRVLYDKPHGPSYNRSLANLCATAVGLVN